MLDTSKFTYSDSWRDNKTSKPNDKTNRFYKSQINKKQFSVLTRSFFYSGLSYILLCLFSIAFVYMFRTINLSVELYRTLTIVAMVVLFVSLIASAILISRFLKFSKKGYSAAAYMFTILSNAFAFGLICSIWGYHLLIYAFVAGGLVLILAGLISLSLSRKAAFTLSKVYMALGLGLSIVFLVSAIVALSMPQFAYWWYFIVYAAFGLYVFIDTIISIKKIQIISEYQKINESSDSEEIKTLSLYSGYLLLCSFIQTAWILLTFLVRFSGSSSK